MIIKHERYVAVGVSYVVGGVQVYSYTHGCPQGTYEVNSSGLNHKLISFWAASTLSEPWQMLRPISTQKSPRRVPGLESLGLVSPNTTRPVLTTPVPCQTMGTTGPLAMYLTRPPKNGLELRSA